jgi:hypothetical protein
MHAALVSPLVLAAVAALLAGCGGEGSRSAGEGGRPPVETTYRSAEWGYTVTVPDGWHRAEQSLTPTLTDPREILSLGTFPLRYRRSECAHVPTSALEDMTAADVFVTIQERGLDPDSDWPDFPPRPAHFRFEPGQDSEAPHCVRGSVRFVDHWFGFSDAGRHFHVEVALGTAAAEDLRREAYRILDSLRLDPNVKADWRASG